MTDVTNIEDAKRAREERADQERGAALVIELVNLILKREGIPDGYADDETIHIQAGFRYHLDVKRQGVLFEITAVYGSEEELDEPCPVLDDADPDPDIPTAS